MYTLETKTKFRRDLRRVHKRNWDMSLFAQATDLLMKTGTLPEDYRPHPLRGEYDGYFDAHIKPDWVLIYEIDEDEKIIVLHRTGSHQDVFKKY